MKDKNTPRNNQVIVIDTNVFLYDPKAMLHLQNNDIVIPFGVLEEIDNFKKQISDLGANSRTLCRYLDKLRQKGSLASGVSLDSGGKLTVIQATDSSIHVDKQILDIAKKLKQENPDKSIVILTRDINLRIQADALGIAAEDYEIGKTDIKEINKAYEEVVVKIPDFESFEKRETIDSPVKIPINEYVMVKTRKSPENFLLGRIIKGPKIEPLLELPNELRRVTPRNTEQWFAMDALLNNDISLVSLIGHAGTGKTLLAVAAGLYKINTEKVYDQIIVSRPIMPIGKDIGYLPGNMDEKMIPWIQPIFDALGFVNKGTNQKNNTMKDIVKVEPITYIRGRTFNNCYIIIDESQNVTPSEIKTIITRVGNNSKIVLAGDIYQIDNPYIDASNNGLSIVANKFKNNSMCAHVHLHQGVRSPIAELAANIL